MIKFVKDIWKGTKEVLEMIGTINAFLLLAIIFIFIIGPISIIKKIIRIFSKPNVNYGWIVKNNKSNDFSKQY